MALNTPEWQKGYNASTTALADEFAESGVTVVDTDKSTVVVMDGTTPGGHPLAKESVKLKSGVDGLLVNGGSEADLSGDLTLTVAGGGVLGAPWGKRVSGDIPEDPSELIADMPVGSFVVFEDLINNDPGVNIEAIKSDIADLQTKVKAPTIYIGGEGASDELVEGRGLDKTKPFATLTAAYNFVSEEFPNASKVRFLILGDVDNGAERLVIKHVGEVHIRPEYLNVPDVWHTIRGIFAYNGPGLFINHINFESYAGALYILHVANGSFALLQDVNMTFSENNCITCELSTMSIYNTTITSNGGYYGVIPDESSIVFSGACVMNGNFSGTVLHAKNGAVVKIINDGLSTFTGSAVGRKFEVTHASSLIVYGSNDTVLPGSVAGVTDTSSKLVVQV